MSVIAVVGGVITPAGTHPATGALLLQTEPGGTWQYLCTGTLVAPDLVLTAAHCLHERYLHGLVPAFTLASDARTARAGEIHAGAAVIPYPAFIADRSYPETLERKDDIGVLVLAEPIVGVPLEVAAAPGDEAGIAAGGEVQIVGYGLDRGDAMEAGVKRSATTHVVELGDWEVALGRPGEPQNCVRDSGGPAFADSGMQRRLVGVVSRGYGPGGLSCDTGGIDTRVDRYREWIDGIIHDRKESHGGCAITAATGQRMCGGQLFLATLAAGLLSWRRRSRGPMPAG